MRIPSFNVENIRSIVKASCDDLPPLMVIAGPNGAGKSTLLNALRNVEGSSGRIIYISPHRTSRRQSVQARHLFQQEINVEALMAGTNMPGLEGIGLVTGLRDAWSFDDAVNYLKHGLCQIEIDRQQAIAKRVDKDGEILRGTLPDVWGPLRELVANLLPHLRFHGIDTTNRNEVRCLWEVHKKGIVVDLDDLSSGEKSIIQMFYPIIEHNVRALIVQMLGETEGLARESVSVLIDEPELHLHPNLQSKVLDYLRVLTSDEQTQVVIATHSPNMVEYATSDELYLLRPIESVLSGENQLIKVADTEEKLIFLREQLGTTANLTAFLPIVVVEGTDKEAKSARITDRKLLRAMNGGFDRVTIIPAGGKAECIRLRDSLESALSVFSGKLRVVALLDRDVVTYEPIQPNRTLLPVSMIENLLLDPETIWDAIQGVVERTPFKSAADVARAIDALLSSSETREVERRVLAKVGAKTFRLRSPLDNSAKQVGDFLKALQEELSPEALAAMISDANREVAEIKSSNKRREFFHGKTILDEFYSAHLHTTGLPKELFRFEAARYARNRKSVTEFFNGFLGELIDDQLQA